MGTGWRSWTFDASIFEVDAALLVGGGPALLLEREELQGMLPDLHAVTVGGLPGWELELWGERLRTSEHALRSPASAWAAERVLARWDG